MTSLCLFLSLLLVLFLFGGLSVTASAKAGSESCAVRILSFDEIRGMIGNGFYRFVQLFRRTDETNVPKPAALPDKTPPAGELSAVDPAAPVVQAQTWRCVELVFNSEKTTQIRSRTRRSTLF